MTVVIGSSVLLMSACSGDDSSTSDPSSNGMDEEVSGQYETDIDGYEPFGELEEGSVPYLLVEGAEKEVERGVVYDASYEDIDYPGGDVARDRGACTDVVVRAFRNAGYDLQKLIHEDMEDNFQVYPDEWGLSQPDPNIDHRRAPNQKAFFRRFAKVKEIEDPADDVTEYEPGDIVFWYMGNGRDHVGIISDKQNSHGNPMIVHNQGRAKLEDCLFRWEITGHFRYKK